MKYFISIVSSGAVLWVHFPQLLRDYYWNWCVRLEISLGEAQSIKQAVNTRFHTGCYNISTTRVGWSSIQHQLVALVLHCLVQSVKIICIRDAEEHKNTNIINYLNTEKQLTPVSPSWCTSPVHVLQRASLQLQWNMTRYCKVTQWRHWYIFLTKTHAIIKQTTHDDAFQVAKHQSAIF